jgi:hypothetical protein
MAVNKRLVLISGKSAGGKSASLRNLRDPQGVLFLNCEAGKELPFAAPFRSMTVTDPYQVWDAFDKAEASDKIHTIIIDTFTFLMEMFESVHVIPAADGRAAWGLYAQFVKTLMQEKIANSSKNVIILAHTMDILNEKEGVMDTLVKVKGSTMNQGVEAYFTVVVAAKKMATKKLEKYKNDHLTITEDEEIDGFKYVFQTRLTKDTVNERIRSPMGLWSREETFIDNDAQFLIDQLDAYYK